jgi:endonuclease III
VKPQPEVPGASDDDLARLVVLIEGLEITELLPWKRASEGSDHLGGVLVDAVLQSGINYRSVVEPRVKSFMAAYPSANTLPGLRQALEAKGPQALLNVANARKLRTLPALVELMSHEGVETVKDFKRWMARPACEAKLAAVHGVGPKTIAFLKLLLGIDAIAIDVHILRETRKAGVGETDPARLADLFAKAARRCGQPLAQIDGALWKRAADRSKRIS